MQSIYDGFIEIECAHGGQHVERRHGRRKNKLKGYETVMLRPVNEHFKDRVNAVFLIPIDDNSRLLTSISDQTVNVGPPTAGRLLLK